MRSAAIVARSITGDGVVTRRPSAIAGSTSARSRGEPREPPGVDQDRGEPRQVRHDRLGAGEHERAHRAERLAFVEAERAHPAGHRRLVARGRRGTACSPSSRQDAAGDRAAAGGVRRGRASETKPVTVETRCEQLVVDDVSGTSSPDEPAMIWLADALRRAWATRSTGSPAAEPASEVARSPGRGDSATSASTNAGAKSGPSLRRSARCSSPSMLSSTLGPSTGVHRSLGAPGPVLEKLAVFISTPRSRAASFTTTPSPGTRRTGPRIGGQQRVGDRVRGAQHAAPRSARRESEGHRMSTCSGR